MTDEKVRSRNAALIETIKKDAARIERVRAAAPLLLAALRRLVHEIRACQLETDVAEELMIADEAIAAAEGNG